MVRCLNNRIFDIVSQVVSSVNVRAWVIGGYVRDCLLKREHAGKDIDIVVLGSGIDVARKVAKKLLRTLK